MLDLVNVIPLDYDNNKDLGSVLSLETDGDWVVEDIIKINTYLRIRVIHNEDGIGVLSEHKGDEGFNPTCLLILEDIE
jgi:regulation of enolase protein 1 (concanavalin A-like superfamily)